MIIRHDGGIWALLESTLRDFSKHSSKIVGVGFARLRNRSLASGDLKFVNAISQSSWTLNGVD
jgi:hypothetical protein